MMITQNNYKKVFLFATTLAMFNQLPAQFIVEDLENPESKFTLLRAQESNKTNSVVVSGSEVPVDPELGQLHAGQHSLSLTPNAGEKHLNIGVANFFTRAQIAEQGAILYSADLFLPAVDEAFPAASLSIRDSKAKSTYAMYRFGVTENVKQIYFSFTDGVNPSALIHHKEEINKYNLRRPGWNRFQVLITGKNLLVCAVNGQQTEFSPIQESTLDNLTLSVSANSTTISESVYFDNLSISPCPTMDFPLFPTKAGSQTSAGVPPQTPKPSPTPSATTEVLKTTQTPENPVQARETPTNTTSTSASTSTGSTLAWNEDPREGWKQSQKQNLPMVIFFTNSTFASHQKFSTLFQENTELKSLFEQKICVQLDVTKEDGQNNAIKFKVYQLPTILVLGLDGQEVSRLPLITDQTTPEDIIKILQIKT